MTTTAETNNERATVEEFKRELGEVVLNAKAAGVPEHEVIFALCELDIVFARPAEVMVVSRFPDGQTLLEGGPGDWEDRHRMLIDALGEVKRQAGVTHGRPFWEEAPDDGK